MRSSVVVPRVVRHYEQGRPEPGGVASCGVRRSASHPSPLRHQLQIAPATTQLEPHRRSLWSANGLDGPLESERRDGHAVDREDLIAARDAGFRGARVGDDVGDDDGVALGTEDGADAVEIELGLFAGGGRIELDAEGTELVAAQ